MIKKSLYFIGIKLKTFAVNRGRAFQGGGFLNIPTPLFLICTGVFIPPLIFYFFIFYFPAFVLLFFCLVYFCCFVYHFFSVFVLFFVYFVVYFCVKFLFISILFIFCMNV